MHIAIIGTGRMAKGLARGWLHAGHTVTFGSRAPEQRRDLLTELPGATITDAVSAMERAEIVVLALPFGAVKDFVLRHADLLRERLVIDITNPFDLLPDNRIAGAEITATAIGDGARVIAAFKDNFWRTLDSPVSSTGLIRDVHFAGDDEEGKAVVTRLVEDLGFRPVDCGPLRNARVLDAMVPLMLELDQRYGGGAAESSWKFLTS